MNKVRVAADELSIEFEPPVPEKLTKQEAEFVVALDRLVLRVMSSFRDPARRRLILDKIVAIINTRNDFLSTNPSVSQLTRTIQIPILHEAHGVRRLYLSDFKRYGTRVLICSVLLLIAWVLMSYKLSALYAFAGPLGPAFVSTTVSVVGSIGFTGVGLVLGFGFNYYLISNNTLTIDNFDQVQKYDGSVSGDFFRLYIITAIVLISLYFQILTLGILNLNFTQIEGKPWLGLLVGIVCGISEPLIVVKLKQVFRPQASKVSDPLH